MPTDDIGFADCGDWIIEVGELIALESSALNKNLVTWPGHGWGEWEREGDLTSRAVIVTGGVGCKPGSFTVEGEWFDQTDGDENQRVLFNRYNIDTFGTALLRYHYGIMPEFFLTDPNEVVSDDILFEGEEEMPAKKKATVPKADVEPPPYGPGDVVVALPTPESKSKTMEYLAFKIATIDGEEFTGEWWDQSDVSVKDYDDVIYQDEVDEKATEKFREKYGRSPDVLKPAPKSKGKKSAEPTATQKGVKKMQEAKKAVAAANAPKKKPAVEPGPKKLSERFPVGGAKSKAEQTKHPADIRGARRAVEASAAKGKTGLRTERSSRTSKSSRTARSAR